MTADGELAREAAEVFAAADPTGSKSIRQLAELVARRVPACSGATAALWQAGEMVTMAASDPDVAALTSLQIETRSGPLIETLRTKQPGGCADTLADDRWQEFAAAALSKGVLASMLAAFGAAGVANASRYGDAQRTASQLQGAVAARAVVDQAKGILMHALRCDADEAFERLRHISQTQHIKLTEVARRLVETGVAEPSAPEDTVR